MTETPNDPQLIIDHLPDLLSTHNSEGYFSTINEAFQTLLGYESSDLINKHPFDFVLKEDLPKVTDQWFQQKPSTVEYRLRKKDGKSVELQTKTKMVVGVNGEEYYICSTRDITAFNNLKTELTQIRTMLDEASRMADFGAWEVQLDPFRIVWSKTVYDIHGVGYDTQPDLLDALSFFVGDDRKLVQDSLDELIQTGKPYDLEVRFRSADGVDKWVRTIGKAREENGKITRAYGVFQDVSKMVRDKLRLTQLTEYLERKKNQLEQFNQIVSHNLRAPIANVSLLLNHYQEAETIEEKEQYIQFLKQSSDGLHELMEELVEAVKIQNDVGVVYDTIDIDKKLDKVLKTLSVLIATSGANIQIRTKEWTTIEYSKIYLESIITNLITNAIKYSKPGDSPQIFIDLIKKKDEFILQVEDKGIGIDLVKHKDKVFKLHKTFNKDGSGKGLGLFMTKQQVEAMGGEISLTSEPGKGSTFVINLLKYAIR